ncbi:MAG: histidinol-phosphatase HisJ family protein [Butyrivibrio sp.]
MIGDYHIHTHFSSDSKVNPKEYIEKAIQLGMKEICFTDHMDMDYPPENGVEMFRVDIDKYFEELSRLRWLYRDRIKIKIGIELGVNPSIYDANREFIQAHPFDFIIGSSHIVNGIDPYYPYYWENRTPRECIMEYYEAILKNVTFYNDYDVYGHLDYVRRYVPDKSYVYVDEDFYEITDMILKNIIARGRGIELNTRSLADGFTTYIPTISLLERYRKLGGEIVTVGSDSHSLSNLGYGFKTAMDILINTGFKYITTFENRKAAFVPL